MSSILKTIRPLLFLLLLLLMTMCATGRKNPYSEKRVRASSSDASHLGRNKYYFSSEYQKKLYKSYKKK
jgi:hypothetical protein